MIYRTINLDKEHPEVTLTTYIPAPSSEYQEDKKTPAVIVCPGGAYQFLSDREGEPIALKFNAEGYAAFVLRYCVGTEGQALQPGPLFDLGKAMAYVKEHAREWRIDAERISICGFSAGGHLCASYASLWHESWFTKELGEPKEKLRPYAAILGYPVTDMLLMRDKNRECPTELMEQTNIAMFGEKNPGEEVLRQYSPVYQIGEETVPCFIWHTAKDELVDLRNSLRFAEELYLHQIPFQLFVYPFGMHGLALSNSVTDCGEGSVREDAEGWFEAMKKFLEALEESATPKG